MHGKLHPEKNNRIYFSAPSKMSNSHIQLVKLETLYNVFKSLTNPASAKEKRNETLILEILYISTYFILNG